MPIPACLTQYQNCFPVELLDWLRIPSVSADPKSHADVQNVELHTITKIGLQYLLNLL